MIRFLSAVTVASPIFSQVKEFGSAVLTYLSTLVTPFSGGKPDISAFRSLIRRQIAHGIDALVVCGTTGEVSTLTTDEKKELLTAAVEEAHGRVPVIGTGGNDTAKACGMSRFAAKIGCDGILSVAPYYNKGTRHGLEEHYRRIAQESDGLPVILYNVPTRTGVDLSPALYAALAKVENIVGVKESCGRMDKILKTMSLCGEDFAVYSGNDSDALPVIAMGGAGVISVASNLYPGRVSRLCRAALDGDMAAARAENKALAPLFEALFFEVNPVPVKTAMAHLGLCENEFRLPLTGASGETLERLKAVLETLGKE